MNTSFDREKGLLIVKLPNNPDVTDFRGVKEEVSKYQELKELRIDFKDVPFLQSKLIAELISVKKYTLSKNVKLILTNIQEGVLQVLEISNLLDHFTLEKDFRSYTPHELSYLLLDPEMNDSIIEFVANNFNDVYLDFVRELLNSDDPILIESAVMIIGKTHSYEFLDKIKECLNSPYPNVVRAAILVLGWFGEEDCKEKIYDFLGDEHIDVAEAAAATIALLADEDDSIAIKEYLNSNDERLRKIAIQALGLINDEFAYKFLIEHLKKEKDDLLRAQLAKTISYFNKPDVADILLNMLSENSIKIREAAASSLIRIKATDKIDRIMSLVSDKDVWVAYFAVKAVGELCKDKKCSDELIKIYPKVDTQVRIAIIEALGKMGFDSSDFLFQLLDDENEDIRKEALNSLALVNKDIAIEASYNALRDSSWVVRFKAVEIIEEAKPEGYLEKLKEYGKMEGNRYIKEKIHAIVGEL